jgi:2-amino-4-hydroxy-6-hydroxymethyldihydropteridine diphosphokinase
MAEAFLALGGNIGDSRTILNRAVAMLCDGKDITCTARSSDYVTPPWGMKYQPPFVNLCLAIETALTPHKLLERTQEVELKLGRDRLAEKRWGSPHLRYRHPRL